MPRIITAYQRLTLDDAIDATELCAEAVLRGDGFIDNYRTSADNKSFRELMQAHNGDEFKVYKHDFFKCADASKYEWKYEGSVIKFMCAIEDYFHMSGVGVVYIHFR